MMSAEPENDLVPYADGEITRRLQQLDTDSELTSDDPLEAFRAAASVLAAVNPATLQPVGEVSGNANALVLLPLLQPAHPAEKTEGFPWTLSRDERRSALRVLHTRDALRNALAANDEKQRPATLLQRTLTDAINGKIVDIAGFNREQLAELDTEQLAALLTTSDWLEKTEIEDTLPRIYDLQQAIERRRDRGALQQLASRTFTGREVELEVIRTHLDSDNSHILWISAPGGTGKSALIANALLTWSSPDRRGIRVDLDHSHVRPERPQTLLAEAAKQLLRQEPDLKSLFTDFVQSSQKAVFAEANVQLESVSSGYDPQQLVEHFISIMRSFCRGNRRVALCIDTFEEAQFLGLPVEERLLTTLFQLADVHGLRIIISGRAGPMVLGVRSKAIDVLRLDDLPIPAAESLLKRVLTDIDPARAVDDAVVRKAVSQLGGNPLTLRLAARLMSDANPGETLDLAGIQKEALQSQLYSRVLSHLHDEAVRPLAIPGLTVRRITPDIIRHVLAEPCGLTVDDDNCARDLFEKLAKENTLVDREGDMLVHRQDIRRVMIAAMPSSLAPTVAEIDRRAAEWWGKHVGAVPRAEEIYHRLRLGHDPAGLVWDNAASSFLRSALEEFPAGSPQRLWLGDKLGVVLNPAESSEATQEEWELQAALEAQRLLDARRPEEALAVLARRKERLRLSPLFAIESRALLVSGKPLEALKVARRGIGDPEPYGSPVAVDLLSLIALIEERLGNPGPALEASKRAVQLAGKEHDVLLQLAAHLRLLRSQRMAKVPITEPSRLFAKSLAERAGPNLLASKPDMLRELAAELGDMNPEFLKWAVNVLDEALLTAGSGRTVELLEELGVVSNDEAQSLRGSDSRELTKIAKSRVSECLYNKDTPQVTAAVQQFFREVTDAMLLRDFTEWSAERPVVVPQSSADDTGLRKLVEHYVSRLPEDSLERIARFGGGIENSHRQFQKRSPAEIAAELVERASHSGNLANLIGQIEQSVAYVLPDEDLTQLKETRAMLELKEP